MTSAAAPEEPTVDEGIGDEIEALFYLPSEDPPLFEFVEVSVYFYPEVLIEKGLSIELDILFP